MPSIDTIRTSNARIISTLPSGLVAVFIGGTSGVGETTAKQFAKHTTRPEVYIVGRSREAGDRIVRECSALNAGGSYYFVQATDLGLIKNVDAMCEEIKKREKAINLLFLTQGTLESGKETSEALSYSAALTHYGRIRCMLNLLPLLREATSLRRVVSVFVGSKEGPVEVENLQARNKSISQMGRIRAHGASLATLALEQVAKLAPSVSFIHGFPGPVKSGIARGPGLTLAIVRAVFSIIGPFLYIPFEEAGERHLYLATSARYPAGSKREPADRVSIGGAKGEEKEEPAQGTNGQVGSGIYTLDEWGDAAGAPVVQLLAELRSDGTAEKVWADAEEQFVRITGQVMA